MRRWVFMFAVMLALYGCGTPPALEPVAPTASTARRAPSLAVEREWLESWFKGTPVAIAQHGDSAVSVDVPLEFCFEPARSNVKPPLAAVLDKMSESLRRTRQARLQLLAAPGDAPGGSQLAVQRATQVRAHLISRGVPAARVGKPTATAASAVQLRMELVAQQD